MKKVALIVFPIIILVVGIAVLSWGLRLLDKAQASENWPTVQGIVISSEFETNKDRDNDSDTTYSAEVVYKYIVGDHEIIGNRVRFVKTSTSNAAEASRDVNQYPQGKTVTVYYNPEDAFESVLEPGKNASVWYVIIFGLMFALVGGLSLLIGIFSKNRDIKVTTRISSSLD